MNLVTGATGHIGNVLVRELLSSGEKVRALILPGEDLAPLIGLELDLVEGDLLDKPSLQTAFKGVKQVYHLAGAISILDRNNPIVRQVNVEGTLNILEAARAANIQRLVYTSSIHAITRAPHGTIISECIPFDPQTTIGEYDRSKAEASLAVMDYIREGHDAVLICPTGVIGPYDFRGSEMGYLIKDILHSPVQLYIDGAYDFVDVRDVAHGHVLACRKGRAGETYILSGERISVGSLVESICKLAGKRVRSIKVPLPLAYFSTLFSPLYYRLTKTKPRLTRYALDTLKSNSVISCAKAKNELGYRPRSLHESIRDTISWILESRSPWVASRT